MDLLTYFGVDAEKVILFSIKQPGLIPAKCILAIQLRKHDWRSIPIRGGTSRQTKCLVVRRGFGSNHNCQSEHFTARSRLIRAGGIFIKREMDRLRAVEDARFSRTRSLISADRSVVLWSFFGRAWRTVGSLLDAGDQYFAQGKARGFCNL